MTVSKHWCNLGIDTTKLEDLNFAFANHGEEDEIYPLTTIEIAEAQHKDQELNVYYKKDARMPKKDICLQLVEDTKCYARMQIDHSCISTTQCCSLVPPLPPTPWSPTSQKDNEIGVILERYAYYHPEIGQILQILPDEQETQLKVWTCSTQACHNNSLESVMCRPSRSLHS